MLLLLLRRAAQEYPEDSSLLYELGLEEAKHKNFDLALAAYARASALAPADAEPLAGRAALLRHLGQCHEARNLLEDAIRRHPDSHAIRCAYAWYEFTANHEIEALSAYRAVLQKDPSNVEAAQGLAMTLDWFDLPGQARTVVSRCLVLTPDSPQLQAVAAYLDLEFVRYSEAHSYAESVLQEQPNNSLAKRTLRRLTRRRCVLAVFGPGWRSFESRVRQRTERRLHALSLLADQLSDVDLHLDEMRYRVETAVRRSTIFLSVAAMGMTMTVLTLAPVTFALIAMFVVSSNSYSGGGLLAYASPGLAMMTGAAVFILVTSRTRVLVSTVLRGSFLLSVLLTGLAVSLLSATDSRIAYPESLGVAAGTYAAAVSSWIFVFLCLLRFNFHTIAFSLAIRRAPLTSLEVLLCDLYYFSGSADIRYSQGIRRYLVLSLEELALAVERAPRAYLRAFDAGGDDWASGRIEGIAAGVRDLKKWVLLPQAHSADALRHVVKDIIAAMALGRLDLMPWKDPAETVKASFGQRCRDALRATALAILPLLTVLLLHAVGTGLDGESYGWALVAAVAWLVVSVARRADPLFAENISAMRDLLTIPSPRGAKPSKEERP